MNTMIAGLILFIGVHAVPGLGGLRQTIVSRLGEKPYKAVFAVSSLLGLILIVMGKGEAAFVYLYEPPAWGRLLAVPLMLLAFVLMPAAHMRTNIKRVTRHPMLWGVVLWAVAHLATNGDLASTILFAAFAAYSMLAMVSANLRGVTKSTTRYPLSKDAIVVVAGFLAYGAFFFLHPYLIGVSIT